MEFLQKYKCTEETISSVPQAWKDASIVTIYKKGERTDCGNYRGISLLCIASKIFARILLNRLSTHITPEVVPETQCGFIGNRSTVDMMANVSVGGEVSESFSVTNGVKQGWVLAPRFFSIFLLAMLDEAFRDMGDGVYIQPRQSADLFKVAHFRAKTKTTRVLMRQLLFADDSALVAHSAEEMQKIVDAFSVA